MESERISAVKNYFGGRAHGNVRPSNDRSSRIVRDKFRNCKFFSIFIIEGDLLVYPLIRRQLQYLRFWKITKCALASSRVRANIVYKREEILGSRS